MQTTQKQQKTNHKQQQKNTLEVILAARMNIFASKVCTSTTYSIICHSRPNKEQVFGMMGCKAWRFIQAGFVPFWGTGLGGEILGGLQVTLAKGLHPGQSTCWIQGHGALLKMILLLQRQWFLGCLACSGVNFPGFRLHPNGLFSHRTLPWRNQVS